MVDECDHVFRNPGAKWMENKCERCGLSWRVWYSQLLEDSIGNSHG